MDENRFSLGDLVAHKHYPEKAIGKISKFHNSGRVGVSGDEGTRSFLPKNLILWGACEDSSEVMELSPTPPPTPPIPPAQAQTEELTEHSENCSQCSSQDIRRFHYHDPNEYWFYCRDCGHEGWRHEKLPPAQVEFEKLKVEEVDAMTTPAEAIAMFSEVMEVEEVDAIAKPAEAIAAQADLELPPIPRDFSELEQFPEWWERPILPEVFKCKEDDDDDGEEWWELVDPGHFKTKYRSWKLLIDEGYQIYATPPNSDRLYHCKCELDLDGPDGQIALAQEFIDSWYFAQPSPGQLSLNIPEAVARDPPPRFR